MYLSRLILNPNSHLVRRDLANCQGLHRTTLRAFPQTDGQRDARAACGVLQRLEADPETGRLMLLVQSAVEPNWGALPPRYLARSPETKSVSEHYGNIRVGMVLRFRLRANPTRKIDTKSGPNGEKRKGRRVPVRGEEQMHAWLERKAEAGGFMLRSYAVQTGGRDLRVVGSHDAGPLTFQGVTFEGVLEVIDEVRFRDALLQGVGSAKAYGFGLLSVAK